MWLHPSHHGWIHGHPAEHPSVHATGYCFVNSLWRAIQTQGVRGCEGRGATVGLLLTVQPNNPWGLNGLAEDHKKAIQRSFISSSVLFATVNWIPIIHWNGSNSISTGDFLWRHRVFGDGGPCMVGSFPPKLFPFLFTPFKIFIDCFNFYTLIPIRAAWVSAKSRGLQSSCIYF